MISQSVTEITNSVTKCIITTMSLLTLIRMIRTVKNWPPKMLAVVFKRKVSLEGTIIIRILPVVNDRISKIV